MEPLAFRNTKKKCNFLYALSPVSHLHSSMRAGRISLDCHLIPNESLPISNSNVQLRLSWSYFATSSFKRHNKFKRTEEKKCKNKKKKFTRIYANANKIVKGWSDYARRSTPIRVVGVSVERSRVNQWPNEEENARRKGEWSQEECTVVVTGGECVN